MMTPELLAVLVFLGGTTGIVGSYAIWARRGQVELRRTVEDRLEEVGTLSVRSTDDASSLIRKHKAGPFPAVDRAVRKALTGSSVERWLEQTGVKLTLSGVALLSLGSGLLVAACGTLVSHRTWVGAMGFVLGAAVPFVILSRRRRSRFNRFEEHFPEALDLISRAVRAGHAFTAGLKMVADEMREPVGPEFRKAFDEQNYGLPIKESLNNLADRIPLLDVRFFATAVLIQRETGGNLAEILDNLAAVVRERFKIRRQVRTHTAHGRFTGYVLLGIPAFLAVALSVINPEHMEMLFGDRFGQMMIMGAIVMQIVGWIWIKQVVKIEV